MLTRAPLTSSYSSSFAYSQNEGALVDQLGRQLVAVEAETAARETQNAQLVAMVRELQV